MANKIVVRDRPCKQCGKAPITGYKYCSKACLYRATHIRRPKDEAYHARNRQAHRDYLDRHYGTKPDGFRRRKRVAPHPCEVCGAITQRPRTCSAKCAHKTDKGKEAQHRSCAARRARMRGVTVERVDRIKVFERDGWLCHLCGRKTNKAKLGTTHPMAPELDHIIPLIHGGEHSYANTACSCKRCNARKGTKIIGQPSLLSA